MEREKPRVMTAERESTPPLPAPPITIVEVVPKSSRRYASQASLMSTLGKR
jgi:hypothetical protein